MVTTSGNLSVCVCVCVCLVSRNVTSLIAVYLRSVTLDICSLCACLPVSLSLCHYVCVWNNYSVTDNKTIIYVTQSHSVIERSAVVIRWRRVSRRYNIASRYTFTRTRRPSASLGCKYTYRKTVVGPSHPEKFGCDRTSAV